MGIGIFGTILGIYFLILSFDLRYKSPFASLIIFCLAMFDLLMASFSFERFFTTVL